MIDGQEYRVIQIPAELDEPPVGTVVLDKDETAWQRYRTDYGATTWGSRTTTLDAPIPWGELLVQRGPMVVVYVPDN